jgi:excisionase family DNA binding protein
MLTTLNPITPTPQDHSLARASSEALARLLADHDHVNLHGDDTDDTEISLSANIARLVQQVLEQIAQGQAVVVLPVEKELTTGQAAEIIGVSRPFMIRLLEQGSLPFHMAGTHRRVRLQDALAYQQEKQRQRGILDELTREAQELNMGY